jgi:hypothetical protein
MEEDLPEPSQGEALASRRDSLDQISSLTPQESDFED